MKRLGVLAAGVVLAAMPMAAQNRAAVTGAYSQATLQTVAFGPQDQDDANRQNRDRDGDRNQDRKQERDRERARERREARDRDRDGDRDGDRNHQYNGNNRPYNGNGGYGNGGYGGNGGNGNYRGTLAPEWQSKYNSYYQRWLNYRATNNRTQMRSMEGRMQSIMSNYRIPSNTPYGQIATNGR